MPGLNLKISNSEHIPSENISELLNYKFNLKNLYF